MSEQWRAVVGFEGRYEVSDAGRVRSLDRELTQVGRGGTVYTKTVRGRLLRPGLMPRGHLSVALGRGHSHCVHELVLRAFVGSPPAKFQARHLNGVPNDNRLSNLEWATKRRNTQDRKWHAGASTYILRPDDVREMRKLFGAMRVVEIAPLFGVSVSTVYQVRSGGSHVDVV